jgi:putative membrane protein
MRFVNKGIAMAVLSAGLLVPAGLLRAEDQPTNQGTRVNNDANSGARTSDRAAADSDRSSNRADAKPMDDKQFLTKAAEGNLAEVKLGELAQKQASADDVKRFAQRMIDDHSKALDELKPIAQNKGVTVPTELKGEEKEHYDKLAKLQGKEFDQAYIRDMIRDHDKDIREFKREVQNGKDLEIQAWASKTLPTLQEHDRMIERVAQANGVDVENARTASERQSPDRNDRSGTDRNTAGNNRDVSGTGNTGADTQRPGEKPQK